MTNEERIKADAEAYALPMVWVNQNPKGEEQLFYEYISSTSYIAGATAEQAHNESVRLQLEAQNANVEILLSQKKELTDKAQVLVDALEEISESNCDYESTSIAGKLHNPDCKACRAKEALEQWKSGKPDRPCAHCGKELSRDRNLCCRECGKEVGDDA